MSLKGYIKTDVVTVTTDKSIKEAAEIMRDRSVGDVVVVEEKGGKNKPIGLLTDRDIVIGCVAQNVNNLNNVKVDQVMSKNPVTANINEGVYEVAQKMRKAGVGRMPVVEDDGALTGIITSKNILALINDELTELVSISDSQKEAGMGASVSGKRQGRGAGQEQPTLQ